MNHFVRFPLALSFLLSSITLTSGAFGPDHFDGNQLETYEEISGEREDLDILFSNLTFRFTCEGRPSGFYADADYGCRIFHVCDNSGNGFPVICAKDTAFDQRRRICTDEKDIDCRNAHEWYYLNQLTYPTEITEEYDSKMNKDDTVPSVLPLMII